MKSNQQRSRADDGGRNPISKALRLLRWMIEEANDTVGVREAAVALNVASSSAHRLLNDLVDEGFLRPEQGGRYALGLEFYRLAQLGVQRTPLKSVAMPRLRELASACNEVVTLGLYDPAKRQMVTVATVESNHPLRYVVEVNRWKPVHIAASGAAIMAYLPAAERQAIIAETKLAPATPNSITSAKKLEEQLERVRVNGYAVTHGQRIPGAVGVAAPLFGAAGDVVGCVGITIPDQRFSARDEPRLVSALRTCTKSIMDEIGGRAPGGSSAFHVPAARRATARRA